MFGTQSSNPRSAWALSRNRVVLDIWFQLHLSRPVWWMQTVLLCVKSMVYARVVVLTRLDKILKPLLPLLSQGFSKIGKITLKIDESLLVLTHHDSPALSAQQGCVNNRVCLTLNFLFTISIIYSRSISRKLFSFKSVKMEIQLRNHFLS